MSDRILGYRLSAEFNRTEMCCSCDHINTDEVKSCPECGFRTDFSYIAPDFSLKKRELDISVTNDGYRVVNDRVKSALTSAAGDLEFRELPNEPGYYLMFPTRVIAIDHKLLQFEKKCPVCGYYESVVGAVAFPEHVVEPIASGIYRSDVRLGSRNTKSYVTIVSNDVATFVQDQAFTGVVLNEIVMLGELEREAIEKSIHSNDLLDSIQRTRKPWWKVW